MGTLNQNTVFIPELEHSISTPYSRLEAVPRNFVISGSLDFSALRKHVKAVGVFYSVQRGKYTEKLSHITPTAELHHRAAHVAHSNLAYIASTINRPLRRLLMRNFLSRTSKFLDELPSTVFPNEDDIRTFK
ncbi:hypothetical protein EVAR_8503_1 [Eumeta japonica]|uniref:Uncharacterized protein n=1 Tax=Eumeta variegata TaxID=151549 RepID=A0A4C1TXM5_EUMVA|nr:hypothetical protein EVAR_8503_1 [Eumeta japonica]